ncbi:ZF-HD homeobox protein, Cys/His-rich dimerization domain-containing protein [Artemisia annua]|uniref:ZF-HD homeobox protein, Cys/His-rich dimerization domain-containing protein n=1 Tax=Artemisia annua TaxID=35608 RepID=A0A2U1NN43_ARTAN|nr:ZF-HD homeobox protein, Cys/His-rich dimerization domain-containing protein [Artemisia annua]
MEFHHQEQEQEDEDMPLPISSTYGHNHNIVPLSLHHHHHKPPHTDVSNTIVPSPQPPPLPSIEDLSKKMMVVVRYKECLKNHAASMGGKATDGCGEFLPSGEEGTPKSLICSVCNCHRNFHRKEVEGHDTQHHSNYHNPTTYDCNYHTVPPHLKRFDLGNGRNLILQGHHPKGIMGTESLGYNHNNNVGALVPSRGPPQMIMSYNMGMGMGSYPSESDEQEDGAGYGGGYLSRYPPPQPAPLQQVVKKRFRTKFTQEQKEKMVSFAEKVGWKLQRQEEAVIQEFCQEIGIKRRVLKVWMHNNKQHLAKNNVNNPISINPPQEPN